MKHLKTYSFSILFILLSFWAATGAEAANSMAPYLSTPIFMSNAVPPNVLIIFDNSGSMNQMAYWEEAVEHSEGDPWWQVDIVPTTPYDPARNYYGYFVAGTPANRVMYSYTSNKFQRDPSGEWEGNFLNWLTMRRADVARKVLVGGLATSRTGGGNTTLIGEDPVQSGRSFKCKLGFMTMFSYTPFNDFNDRYVGVKDGYLYVSKDLNTSPFDKFDYKYTIKVQRDSTLPDEAFDFHDGNIAGVMQKVGDKAYWGLEFFRSGTGNGENGGYIKNRVGHPTITNLYTNIENEPMQNWTPLAESLYVAMQYFKQEPIDASLASLYNPGYQLNSAWDPYDQDGDSTHCAKSFVLIFTDGASTKDMMVPDALKTYDGDSHDPNAQTPSYADDGSDYLDDVALYARTNDLRTDLESDQNLEVFVVYAFGDDPAARRLLKDTSRNGGFIEKNGNGRPDPATGTVVDDVDYATPPSDNSWSEWWEDKRTSTNGNALPDTYFEAKDGWQLELELINAITKILQRANSGTAVSVLATSGEGEGALYQAYFKPKFSTATEEVHWTGYLQGLWTDALGNLREDWTAAGNPTPDGKLELGVDPIVTFFYDENSGETTFQRRAVSLADIYGSSSSPTTHPLNELSPLWEAGSALASRDLSTKARNIYTFVDSDGFIPFTETNAGKLKPYLDLADPAVTGIYDYLDVNEDNRVTNLIRYIRGIDSGFSGTTNLRNRTLDSKIWRLGDIVHSTPTPIGRPVDNYDLIYSDDTYADFYRLHKNRETVVYTGANDGMLHAFLAGEFSPGAPVTGDGASFSVDPLKYGPLGPGDEIWSYIPQSLLPHLKWLADPGYMEGNHVYYVDQKPRIFDARIYEGATDSAHPLHDIWTTQMNNTERDLRPYGWSTVLVGAMRFGGGSITVNADWDNTTPGTEDREFTSSYFAIDITDPLNPILLWERSYNGLGFTTSFPAVLKVEDRVVNAGTPDTVDVQAQHWFLLFGSGPTDYDGTSSQNSSIFVVDMATGNPERTFTELTDSSGNDNGTSLPDDGFMGSPISIDLTVDYSVNVSYLGESHESGGSYDGGLYRLQVPVTVDTANGKPVLLYDVDPDTWTLTHMFDADYAITAAPAAAVGTADSNYSLWLYFGTGRYLANADKADTTQQYLYGIKDPYYNFKLDPGEQTALLNAEPLDKTALFDTTGVTVYTDGSIAGTGEATTFGDLKIRQGHSLTYEVGWYKELDSGERIVSKPSVLGGILLAPSFVPNNDVCGFGGNSYLHALYFETGTAYSQSVVGTTPDGTKDKVLDKIGLGVGISSSLGIHVGREHGARGFIQQSTGTINQIDLTPALSIKSGFVNWREVR
ncbi:MAG: PilC/PilY family type IV pilus protein [Syntrophobacteria bacterium]